MTVKLKKSADKKTVYNITELIVSATWSGTDTQVSRSFEFAVAADPFDKNLNTIEIELGDIIYMYFEKELKFVGRVVRKSKTSGVGEYSFTAQDYMNVLLRSTVSYRFKNKSPYQIAEKIISDLGVPKGKMLKPKMKISKWIVENENPYNVIVGAYHKAYKKLKKKYMPVMDGARFSVVEKGTDSGCRLYLDRQVTSSSLEENAEDVVNQVVIYNDKKKKIGTVKDSDSIKLFGRFQQILDFDGKGNAKKEAQELLKAPTKEAKVESIGDIRCVSGKSVMLYDRVTGLYGKFWIENDSHSFSGGVHTMSLSLAFKNLMEGDTESRKAIPIATGDSVCYYSTNSHKYHSAKKCGTGLAMPIKSKVSEAVKTGRGKCSRCWQ